jgi:pimeloyl-ACP methyl ester carboxylesterase
MRFRRDVRAAGRQVPGWLTYGCVGYAYVSLQVPSTWSGETIMGQARSVLSQASQTVEREFAHLHGRTIAYREHLGAGTPILLVHGIGSNADTWQPVFDLLAGQGAPVIAVDLPGHGESSKEPGDYSLGAMASTLRDLLDLLGHERVHLVGHSLGGGISLQFAYQFPARVDRLILASSGGLGEETFIGLRAAALPGAALALKIAINRRTIAGAARAGRLLAKVGMSPHALSSGALRTVSRLDDEERREAFLATLRSVVGVRGQRVSALDKLYLLDGDRVLIIWGEDDPMIPMAHGAHAHSLLEGSRFVSFPDARHEPHVDDPARFAALLLDHVNG